MLGTTMMPHATTLSKVIQAPSTMTVVVRCICCGVASVDTAVRYSVDTFLLHLLC